MRAYLISGDDPLLSGEAADAIRASARAKGFTERDVHFMERGSDWDDVRASSSNMSLFGSRRLVEIRMPTGKPGVAGGAALVAMLEIDDQDTVYLIMTPRLDRDVQSANWVKAVEAKGAFVQVWPIDSDRMTPWLRGRAKRLGLDITADGIEVLAERTEGNLLAAHQELEKLKLVAQPGQITADTILASVGDSARFDVFQLGESVLAGDTERALRMLAGLRAEGVEAVTCSMGVDESDARPLGRSVGGSGGTSQSLGPTGRCVGKRCAPRFATAVFDACYSRGPCGPHDQGTPVR